MNISAFDSYAPALLQSLDCRERLAKLGVGYLDDSDLFALVLRSGTPQCNVMELSNRLMREQGIPLLERFTLEQMQGINGLGPAKAGSLVAAFELGRRAQFKGQTALTAPNQAYSWFIDMALSPTETFRVLALNVRRQVIEVETISKGTLTETLVHPREVFRFAVAKNAAAVLVGHNHPSGDPSPSAEDLALTRRLVECGQLLGIELLDHLIIGRDGYRSIMALGPDTLSGGLTARATVRDRYRAGN